MENQIIKLGLVEKRTGFFDSYGETKVLNKDKSLAFTFKSINKQKRWQMVNPERIKRRGSTDIRDIVANKWKNTPERVSGSGNVHHDTYFDSTKGKIVFLGWKERPDFEDKDVIMFSRLLPPHLLLYRMCATFFGQPSVEDNYKYFWGYTIEHKLSGKSVTFSEWKGAPGFWLPEHSHEELTQVFREDLTELLLYLISDQCAHPYDGCTAGQIA